MARPLAYSVEDILEAIAEAQSFVRGMTFDQFLGDKKTQRAVERSLEVISEASRDVPDDIKANHVQTPWSDIASIGNVLRHRYYKIAMKIVWDTVQMDLPALEVVMRAIQADLPEEDNS